MFDTIDTLEITDSWDDMLCNLSKLASWIESDAPFPPEPRVRHAGVRGPANSDLDPDLDLNHDLAFYICEVICIGFVGLFRAPRTHSNEYMIAWYGL